MVTVCEMSAWKEHGLAGKHCDADWHCWPESRYVTCRPWTSGTPSPDGIPKRDLTFHYHRRYGVHGCPLQLSPAHLYEYIYIYKSVLIHVYMHLHTCIYVYMCVYIYVCIYVYM